MTIIKIQPFENGAHDNLTTSGVIPLPDGWAILPESVGTPETLESFPFGEVTAEKIDGVMTVTSWIPGVVPDPEPVEPETELTVWEELDAAYQEGVDSI